MAKSADVGHTLRRGPRGLQLYASENDEPRARRPTDVALAISSAVAIVVASALSTFTESLEAEFSELLGEFPGLFRPLWLIAFWAPIGWVVVLVIASVARRRPTLARDLLVAAGASVLVAAVISAIVMDDGRDVLPMLLDVGGPPVFPPAAVALASAVIATASPHLSRPFRHFGRWLIASQFVGSLFLGAAVGTGAAAAIAIGLLSAALVHLVAGSPGGRPTASRIRIALADLGVAVEELTSASMHREGVVLFEGRDREGPLRVKVYGRDAWDAQLLANVWRLMWYRGSERTARLNRVDLVEHEGFVTLLAEREGVNVPRVVTVGSAGRGDALVVVRPIGVPVSLWTEPIDDRQVATLWEQLARLHDAGMSHRMIDGDRVVVDRSGALGFGDLSSGSVVDDRADVLRDRAQALALSIALVGEDRALATAREVAGDEMVRSLLPYLQDAAVPPHVRDALAAQDVDLDDVRDRAGKLVGADDQPLIKLRRVTGSSVLNLALLGLAAYAIIGLFSDIDLQSFVDALRDANWWWLALALVLAQLPRFPSAISTMGSLAQPLPLGPLTALQFAICYVNLAIPSTAARVAVTIRFFQRFGVSPTTAVSAGVIDSVSGFVVQIGLFLGLFFASDADLGLSTDPDDLSGLGTIVLIGLAVIVLFVVLTLVVAPLRRRVLHTLHQAREALRVLRSPTKLLQLFGGNLVSQVMFGVALGACVVAFGGDVPLTELVLINTVVSLFAGLLPIPGGVGVSEAGLTIGLTAAGLSSDTAFAVAIAYRMTSFYLPPIWGWFCYRWLVRQRYL